MAGSQYNDNRESGLVAKALRRVAPTASGNRL